MTFPGCRAEKKCNRISIFIGVESYQTSLSAMTTSFYAPPSSIRGSQVVLPDDEARHAAATLRKEAGDEIVVVDGEGGWHRVRLQHVSREQVVGSIVETRREVGEPEADVTVGMALLKKRSRFETFVEKAVELGVRCVIPLRTERTEKKSFREDRVRNVMIAAMKQCGRSRLPNLSSPMSLAELVEGRGNEGNWLVCHERATRSPTVLDALNENAGGEEIGVLVGPEGGFSEREIDAAQDAGCRVVSLGPRRLRAETAGIVAATAVMLTQNANV